METNDMTGFTRTTRFEWITDQEAAAPRPEAWMPALNGGALAVGELGSAKRHARPAPGAPRLLIRNVSTRDQHGDQIYFDPFSSALSLRVTCEFPSAVIALPAAHFTAYFQLVRPGSNGVVVHKRWSARLEWGPRFWISMGNDWGPVRYDTPGDWGLHPSRHGGHGVFGFRAALTAEAWMGEHGMQPVCPYDVSRITWFRVGRGDVG